MGFMDYRLRMLLERNEAALGQGTLTTQQLKETLLETIAYKEPVASDIRIILSGLSVENNSPAELKMRLRQAQRILNLNADFN